MRSITDVVRQFKQNWTEELAPAALAQACRDAGMRWNESAYNPIVTLQLFFVQILHGNTAIEHLKHLTGSAITASAYCQARMRIPLDALYLLLQRCSSQIQPDRGFCSFAHLALLFQRGVHALLRIHQRTIVDFTPGRPFVHPTQGHSKQKKGLPRSRWIKQLGVTDHIVEWFKPPKRPEWMSAEQYATLPDSLMLRELRYCIHEKGFRPKKITLVTTLLDAKCYSLYDLADLFRERWEVEVYQPDCPSSALLYQLAA